MPYDATTIAAIATPPGQGAVGVIRISGSDAPLIAARIFRTGRSGLSQSLDDTNSHRVFYGRIVDPDDETPVDEVMLTWLAAPRTFTREHTVEISCHGGLVPLQETLRVLLRCGARHAEPGEFTLRAFLNGRIDLAEAEAVLNVVTSRTHEGLQLAINDLAGDLTRRLKPARDAVIELLAYLDAAADFPDDEIPSTDIDADLETAMAALSAVLSGSRAGMLHRDGVQIALVGRPNVGKSSLLNALLRSERAIVTPVAGTTRDVIADSFDLRGIPATLLDTAGIAGSDDIVEQLGIERSRRAASSAAAVVLVLDGTLPPDADDLAVARLLTSRLATGETTPVVFAINKSDLGTAMDQSAVHEVLPGVEAVAISARTGAGIEDLESTLHRLLLGDPSSDVQPSLITVRQHAALDRAVDHLRAASATRSAGFPIDLLATDVRAAAHAIGLVTGESVDEAVLTEIFSRFCIGK